MASLDAEAKRYYRELDAALATENEATIRAFLRRWKNPMEAHQGHVFWGGIYKTITARTTLPLELRRKAKHWLDEHGYKSWDDGDL